MEEQNKYQLGSIGVGGHWFRRIYYSMKKDGRMEPGKGVGVSPYRNRSHLQSFGITQDKYYQIEFDEEGKPILVQKSKLTLFDVEYKLDGMNVVPVDKNTGKALDEKQLDLLRKQLMKEWRYVDEDEEE